VNTLSIGEFPPPQIGGHLSHRLDDFPRLGDHPVEELLASDSEDASHPMESEGVIPMVFRFGGRDLRLFSTVTTFGTPMDVTVDEVAIESYYPSDAESAAYFA
jgi:hypothetical protein